MSQTTVPIKNKEDVQRLKDYYRITVPQTRNYTLIVTGLNTALRISDIISLRNCSKITCAYDAG